MGKKSVSHSLRIRFAGLDRALVDVACERVKQRLEESGVEVLAPRGLATLRDDFYLPAEDPYVDDPKLVEANAWIRRVELMLPNGASREVLSGLMQVVLPEQVRVEFADEVRHTPKRPYHRASQSN